VLLGGGGVKVDEGSKKRGRGEIVCPLRVGSRSSVVPPTEAVARNRADEGKGRMLV